MKRTELLEYLITCSAQDKWIPTLSECGKEFWVSAPAIYKHFNALIKEWLLKRTTFWKYRLVNLARTQYNIFYYQKRIEYLEPFKTEYLFAEDCNKALEDWNEQLRWVVKDLKQQKLKHLQMIQDLWWNTQNLMKTLNKCSRRIKILACLLWVSWILFVIVLVWLWKYNGLQMIS